jgi:hypothetical protein
MFNFVPEILVQKELTVAEATELLKKEEFESVVGHSDTANILTNMLHTEIKFNRVSNNFGYGDKILVTQYTGPRLPEGAVSLPEGSKMKFILIEPKDRMSIGCFHCGPTTVVGL